MAVMLPSLALALLCLLRAGAELPVQPGFNADKFAGTWHVTAVVANCSMFMKMKDQMKSSIATFSFTPEGDLLMKLAMPMLDKCQKFELLFQQTGQAGHYVEAEGKKDLRVVETDYSSYAILRELHQSGQELNAALQLLMREQDVSPQLLQKFKELIPAAGLNKDLLVVLPKSDQCSSAIS